MCAWFNSAWERLKSFFGRSKIVFVNVFGAFAAIYVELQDYLVSFNWDDFFKHEVAAAIGFATQILSLLFRIYGNAAPISFKVPADPIVPVAPIAEEVAQSPKAE